MIDLSVEIAGIRMQNPVMNASGTFDLESCHSSGLIDASKLGAYVNKSITYDPRAGNPQPRLKEVIAGVINRIGLENIGTVRFIEEKLPAICAIIEIPLIVSVAGKTKNEYLRTAVLLEEKANGRINGLEINISCPNVNEGGMAFGVNPNITFELISTLKSRVNLPLIVKLTPNVTDISEIARAAESAGADAISLINTLKALDYIWGYEEDGRIKGLNAGQWIEGGLSGPAIRAIAMCMVSSVVKTVKIPVIGMGGISNTKDALGFLLLGAKAIAVGTATFGNPNAIIEIIDGIEQYLTQKGYASIEEFREKEGGLDF